MKAIPIRIGTLTSDGGGQDMVGYALLAGFIAVVAGGSLPNISDNISIIFSRMESFTTESAVS